jgi:hypothetical protein
MKWLSISYSLALTPLPQFCHGWSSLSILGQKSKSIHSSTALRSKSDYNVVFRPSTDPGSFDSLKLGSARVHRYADPNSILDDTEYIMWYHARDTSLDHFGREMKRGVLMQIERAFL